MAYQEPNKEGFCNSVSVLSKWPAAVLELEELIGESQADQVSGELKTFNLRQYVGRETPALLQSFWPNLYWWSQDLPQAWRPQPGATRLAQRKDQVLLMAYMNYRAERCRSAGVAIYAGCTALLAHGVYFIYMVRKMLNTRSLMSSVWNFGEPGWAVRWFARAQDAVMQPSFMGMQLDDTHYIWFCLRTPPFPEIVRDFKYLSITRG